MKKACVDNKCEKGKKKLNNIMTKYSTKYQLQNVIKCRFQCDTNH